MTPEFFEKEKNYIARLLGDSEVPPDSHVLDIGCSDFKPYSAFLASSYARYTGVDLDKGALEKAREQSRDHRNVRFDHGTAEALQYKDDSFDLVLFNNAVAYTDKAKSYAEALRVLKPGGLLISCFNNTYEYSIYKLFHPMKPLFIEWGHTFVVIINTWLYSLTGRKIFRTTFSTRQELEKMLRALQVELRSIEVESHTHPYRVINIVAKKMSLPDI